MTDDLPVVIGVLNVTPDSFSDGGLYEDLSAAVAHGVHLREQGAQYVDVGGESTRPGAGRVDADVEINQDRARHRRAAGGGGPDERGHHPGRAWRSAALEAGAAIINDVSGGLADPAMLAVAAAAGCPYVIMHWRGHSASMQEPCSYTDVVADVRAELAARIDAALAAGVARLSDHHRPRARLREDGDAQLGAVPRAAVLCRAWLSGPVRGRAQVLSGSLLDGRPAAERDVATAATSVLAAQAGVWGVRVHDVQATVDALEGLAEWIE